MPINEMLVGLNLLCTVTSLVMFYVIKREHDRHWDEITRYIEHYIHNVIKQEKK